MAKASPWEHPGQQGRNPTGTDQQQRGGLGSAIATARASGSPFQQEVDRGQLMYILQRYLGMLPPATAEVPGSPLVDGLTE
eukprot:10946789-Karenia_brevis.AAC.1